MLYFDNAASTPMKSKALRFLRDSLEIDFANPSSAHKLGKGLLARIEECRRVFLGGLGAAEDDHFIFTGAATESNNSAVNSFHWQSGDAILLSSGDHPSLVGPCQALRDKGVEIREIPLAKNAAIDIEKTMQLMDEKVRLVALTQVNNISGVIQPVEDLAAAIRQNTKFEKAHLHLDAVQGFCKISLRAGAFDSIAVSSHKMGGPKGVAGLYWKRSKKFSPHLFGGGQEKGLRSGTQAAPLIFSFESAASESLQGPQASLERVRECRDLIYQGLESEVKNVLFPFEKGITSPYILTVILPGLPSDVMLRHLEEKDIYISSSSACSSKIKGDDPAFSVLGIPSKWHKNVLRISLSSETSLDEAREFVRQFAAIASSLDFLRQTK